MIGANPLLPNRVPPNRLSAPADSPGRDCFKVELWEAFTWRLTG
jgi:hypothetical protein